MTVRSGLRRSLPYAAAIIAGFLVAYLIVAFLIFPSGVVTGNAKVPNVTGLLFDDAAKRLAEVGFQAQRGESRFQGGSPKETVLEQDPRAGTRDAEGTAVTLAVSAGQEIVAVPSVVGMMQSEAQTALEDAGFDMAQVTERPNSAPKGEVIESRPAPGTSASIPSSVSLVVSSGANVALVPDLAGRVEADARQLLRRARLAANVVGTGMVVSQSPPAGAQVAIGSSVTVQLSNQPGR